MSDSVTLQTAAHQAPLCMEFSRHKYWSGLPFPTPEDLLNPGIKHMPLASPTLVGRFFTNGATWEVPVSNSKFPLATYFTYGDTYVSMLLFPFVPPSLSPMNQFLGK